MMELVRDVDMAFSLDDLVQGAPDVEAIKKLHVQSFLLEYLIPFAARHRAIVIVTIALATGVSAWLATQLEFDDTIKVLRSARSQAYQQQQRL